MKTKCHRIVSEDSQNLQRYIHIINSYIHLYNSLRTLLKPPSFSAVFSLKTNLLLCARETVLYAGQYLFIVSCSNRGNRIRF